jgi:hypothetical protein
MPLAPQYVSVDKSSIRIDLEIKIPKVEKKETPRALPEPAPAFVPRPVVRPPDTTSLLSKLFLDHKTVPEPAYFQNVDCVGLPEFFTARECRQIIDFAESQGFGTQSREGLLHMHWCDLVDPFFAEKLWNACGLAGFLGNITIDGMVPCGLNDVVRIQKYGPGCRFGRHTDQHVRRRDDKVSKYSLRVFLNAKEEQWFEGGLSAFHVPFRQEPVVFEPETGLALLYPQGERCCIQEEMEVTGGSKYVLRADVLFCRPEEE